MMHLGGKVKLAFDPARVKDLSWDIKDQEHKFDPSHVVDPPEEKQKKSPHAVETKNYKYS